MTKYTLKKKWHPSQVEEVGHVFEEDEDMYFIEYHLRGINSSYFANHLEIALLCDAGYLKKEEKCTHGECRVCHDGISEIKRTGKCAFLDPQLELWTDAPPEWETYFYVTDSGTTEDEPWNNFSYDRFRLKTKNCHKTQKSAEEALKRLMSG